MAQQHLPAHTAADYGRTPGRNQHAVSLTVGVSASSPPGPDALDRL